MKYRDPRCNRAPLSIEQWRGRPPAPPHKLVTGVPPDGVGCVGGPTVARRITGGGGMCCTACWPTAAYPPSPYCRAAGEASLSPAALFSSARFFGLIALLFAALRWGRGGRRRCVCPLPPDTHKHRMQGAPPPAPPVYSRPPYGQTQRKCRCSQLYVSETRRISALEVALSGRSSLKGCAQ